jgi:PAS domain S-box-containing protein
MAANLKGMTLQLLRAVGNCSVDLIYAKDIEGRFLFANPPVLAVYGKSAEEMIGRTDMEIHHDSAQATALMENDRRIITTGRTEVVEETFDVANLGTRVFRSAKAPLRLEDGVTVGIVGVSSDITPLKSAEAALRQLTADLEARVLKEVAAREAAQAQAAQAARLQALGQLAGGIAHDFNNVLQALSGALTLIAHRSADQDEVHRLARLASGVVERGASVTSRLLTFGRSGDLRAGLLDVSAVLASLRELMTYTLGTQIEVDIRLAPAVCSIFADKRQLETVLINLATNARDAMPHGGRLTISADAETLAPDSAPHRAGLAPGRYVRLAVADTGSGMDPATLSRAREPFFTTKPFGTGTGLGLSMAQGFADQSGGALSIESTPGAGTTVTLWLPETNTGEAVQLDIEDISVSSTTPTVAPVRVLVVDDEEIIREVLARQLEEAGHSVLSAASGREALALLAAGEVVAALITDFSMPGMDGLAVIRAARDIHPTLPAVLLSGYAGDDALLAASGPITQSFSVLRKPVSGLQLLDRLHALLAAGSDEGTTRLPMEQLA